ncbi:hypothetical protein PV367_26645 [Streptomyces europaeiscabiei]|uniref:MFS transporter n=1 Tax=Streptomyces europaeiscabiei TaxID=146819 RepID=A0AAJ2UNL0_9ACTN|nr:hypothetical protein [Streptomyces europaeiscabiei]MDX3133275.1 hypothetical protein [Streptomyces europaeiscabiei]
MRATFSTILLSSLGSTVLWLLLVPSFAAQTQSDALVGLLGMERQVLGVVGALLVGVWADRGLIHRKFPLLQGLQLVLAAVFLVMTWLGIAGPDFVLVWTALRFALVGASSVLAYRLLADASGSSSQGAVLQMVTSPQGAMVFAAVICAAVPVWTSSTLTVALAFDLVASVAVLSLLARRLEGTGEPGGAGGFNLGRRHVLARGADAVRTYWLPRLWPWNLLQIGFLVSLSGMMVYASVLAEAQDLVPTGIAFSGAWFFYGLAFWVTAPLLREPERAQRWAMVFAAVLTGCGVVSAVSDRSAFAVHLTLYVVLTFVNAYWIHFSNARILELAPADRLGQVRASMIFYLGVVFGLGEQFVGLLLETSSGLLLLDLLHVAGGIALAGALLVIRTRSRRTLVPAGGGKEVAR